MALRRSLYVALLGSAAFLLMATIEFPLLPAATFLKYDPSEIPTLIATFALGPVAGLAAELVKALLVVALRPGSGGVFGVFMNFLAGATLVGVAGSYYLRDHTKRGGVVGMVLGVLAMSATMVAANVALTPVFYGIPRPQVIALVAPALLPFNLLKGVLSSGVTFLIYKRVRAYLRESIGEQPVW